MEKGLQEFIQSSFKSVWALELLLFLKRNEDRAFDGEELVRELRSSIPVITHSLAHLQTAGLTIGDADGRARYSPASPDLRGLADEVEHAYNVTPNAVRRAILGAPNEPLRTLADAFRLRKDP
jgi:hypothetical protein